MDYFTVAASPLRRRSPTQIRKQSQIPEHVNNKVKKDLFPTIPLQRIDCHLVVKYVRVLYAKNPYLFSKQLTFYLLNLIIINCLICLQNLSYLSQLLGLIIQLQPLLPKAP